MSWATHPTAEMPAIPSDSPGPSGRHRRRGQSAVGILAAGTVLALAVFGAMFSPVLLGWPPPAQVPVAEPTSATPTRADAPVTARATASRRPLAHVLTPTPTWPVRPSSTRPAPPGIESLEAQVVAVTNAERAKSGCQALRLDTRLRTAARGYSDEMLRYGAWNHIGHDGSSPGERMRRAGYDTGGGWAENIAKGYPTADAVMNGWMKSSGHRANILNCDLRALGVGAVRGSNGVVYWTQDFGGR